MAAIAAAIGLLLATVGFAESPPPNILFLLTDDQRWDSLGSAGNDIVLTPHIDGIAQRGTQFRNAFVTTSICAVSRASILSGQYARRHRIVDFETQFSPSAWKQTYPMLLRQRGYRTGVIGKFGVGAADTGPARDFDYWRGITDQEHLSVSWKAPHAQDGAAREFPPDPRDAELFDGVTIPVPKTAVASYFEKLPDFVRKSEGRARWQRRFSTPEMFQKTVKDYYRLVVGVDREVGRILAALREAGAEKNTVVIFSSDNGFFFGEHGMADKWLPYEESIRVPLIISDPRAPADMRGTKRDEIALNIDLAPTILDYAGLPRPREMQGESLRPLVEEKKSPSWRTDFFYEHSTLPSVIPESEAVRTANWKYLRYLKAKPAVEELYDLIADPAEERNLIAEPAHKAVAEQLRRRCADLAEMLR